LTVQSGAGSVERPLHATCGDPVLRYCAGIEVCQGIVTPDARVSHLALYPTPTARVVPFHVETLYCSRTPVFNDYPDLQCTRSTRRIIPTPHPTPRHLTGDTKLCWTSILESKFHATW